MDTGTTSGSGTSGSGGELLPVPSLVALNCVTAFQPFTHISTNTVAVTAIDVLPIGMWDSSSKSESESESGVDCGSLLVAFGSDGGEIVIYQLDKADGTDGTDGTDKDDSGFSTRLVHETPNHWCHGGAIKRLRWFRSNSNSNTNSNTNSYRLLSCGDDNTMRLFNYDRL